MGFRILRTLQGAAEAAGAGQVRGEGAAALVHGLPGRLQELFESWGLGGASAWLSLSVLLVLLALGAALLHFVGRELVAGGMQRLAHRTQTRWDDVLAEHDVFRRLAHLLPVLLLYFAAPLVLYGAPAWQAFAQRVSLAYLVVVAALAVSALLSAGTRIYETEFRAARERPIRSHVQLLRILLWGVAAILILSVLMARSPWAFLGGLGALTAVLLLVFKDAILGFVASVQIAGNDMVRVGDWIEMPDYGADGDVLEISLTTVKVQNWNKTITTIPTYALVSHAFKNWRGMSESGGRRIKRALWIDMASVRFVDAEALERYRRIRSIRGYLERKLEELREHNAQLGADMESLVNGRRLTNLGTFRAYVQAYLREHPQIRQDMTLLVRQLAPDAKGIGIEIYAFSKDQAWANYEAIQADIFDHLLAIVGEFDLRVVQMPSGSDLRALARNGAAATAAATAEAD